MTSKKAVTLIHITKILTVFGFLLFVAICVGAGYIYNDFVASHARQQAPQKIINILHLPAGIYTVLDGVDNGVSTSDGLQHELEYTIKNTKTGEILKIKENSEVHTLYREGSVITIEKPGEIYMEWKDPSTP